MENCICTVKSLCTLSLPISGPRRINVAQTGNDFHAGPSAVALRASCPVFLPSKSGWMIWVGSPGSGRVPTDVSESNLEFTTLDIKWMQQCPCPCLYCARTWDVPALLCLLPVVGFSCPVPLYLWFLLFWWSFWSLQSNLHFVWSVWGPPLHTLVWKTYLHIHAHVLPQIEWTLVINVKQST